MWRLGGMLIVLAAGVAPPAAAADDRDALARARQLYNQRKFEAAVTAADEARLTPARADSADLIAARALLERFRESAAAGDLGQARDRLRRIHPERFVPRERLEFIVGVGETLFFEGSYGAAADLFDSVLAGPRPGDAAPASPRPGEGGQQSGALAGEERERVLDWWATALDRDARPRPEFDRQAIYQRVRDRMHGELGTTPTSVTAVYWQSAAARGQGDLQTAWAAAQAGWARATLAGARGAALRSDLDRLVITALVPERARALGQPPAGLRQEWEQFKERWTGEPPP